MKRRLFNLLAAVSMLLCMLMIGVWLRSHWVTEAISWGNGMLGLQGYCYALQSAHGGITFIHTDIQSKDSELRPGPQFIYNREWPSLAQVLPGMGSEFLGFGYAAQSVIDSTGSVLFRLMAVPDWFIASAFALTPCFWIFRTLRRTKRSRRMAAGLCATCGYDLRATSARCPECGNVTLDCRKALA